MDDPIAPEIAARKAVFEIHDRISDAVRRNDVAAMVDLFAEDAVLLSPDGKTISGREEMLRFAENNFRNGMVDLLSENKCLLVEGVMAVDSGICTVKLKDEAGNPSEAKASYMMVYRRHDTGRWLIERDAWGFLV